MSNKPINPDELKIPAFLRKKQLISQDKQKLIWTALDRKQEAQDRLEKRKKYLAPTKEITPHPRPATTRYMRTVPAQTIEPQAQPSATNPNLTTIGPFKEIGTTTHYFEKINVAIIQTTAALKLHDHLLIQGPDQLFLQEITEMQINRKNVKRAPKNSHIGIKVKTAALENGKVYLVK